jgi:hypothetical protein
VSLVNTIANCRQANTDCEEWRRNPRDSLACTMCCRSMFALAGLPMTLYCMEQCQHVQN